MVRGRRMGQKPTHTQYVGTGPKDARVRGSAARMLPDPRVVRRDS